MPEGERIIDFAGVPLGRDRHICAFFHTVEEEYRVLLPFIKEGLERDEKAFHIVDPKKRADHLSRLQQVGIDTQSAEQRGQLEVRAWQDAHFRPGRFDQDAMLALIEDEVLRRGAAPGYLQTRFVAHMEWALEDMPGVEDLVEYETRLNYIVSKYDDPVICTYDCDRFRAATVMDILRTHPLVIIGRVLQHNPFYVPPDQFLLELRERDAHRASAA
jgi:hypothetical protein